MEEKKWWKEAVVYQIYPRSFQDSNGDGIGDLPGVISRLDYLAKLGITIIWMSPIYPSPNDDNGYDISDYRNIMPEFGTMDDFKILLREAHARNIKIVMDLVVNHTSDEHRWFQESRKDKTNPYRDYYIWRNGKDGKEPNNWGSWFSGSAWEYDETTDMYFLHSFSKKQPDLNWENPKVREAVYDMMRWWCELGVDGFRMDVINMISKDPGFPDGEKKEDQLFGNGHPYQINGPKVHEYLKEMNREVLSRYDITSVGETVEVTTDDALRYAGFDENELNMIFHFEHTTLDFGEYGKWTDKKIDIPSLKKILSKWQYELEGRAWNSLYVENHDQPRIVSRLGNDSLQYRSISAKMLGTLLFSMKGTPYIYQGQELGMTNPAEWKLSECRDIEILNAYRENVTESHNISEEDMMHYIKLKGRDNARTPMQWNSGKNAGFTDGIPWIKVNPNYDEINAKQQEEDSDSVFQYYRKLIRIRKESEILLYGKYELLETEDSQFVFTRTLENSKLLILCNLTEDEVKCPWYHEFRTEDLLLGNYENIGNPGTLRPYEALILKI